MPHPPLLLNNKNVTQSIYQKHLSIILESKFTFENHIYMVNTKINKAIGLLHKLQNPLTNNRLNKDL